MRKKKRTCLDVEITLIELCHRRGVTLSAIQVLVGQVHRRWITSLRLWCTFWDTISASVESNLPKMKSLRVVSKTTSFYQSTCSAMWIRSAIHLWCRAKTLATKYMVVTFMKTNISIIFWPDGARLTTLKKLKWSKMNTPTATCLWSPEKRATNHLVNNLTCLLKRLRPC